MAGGQVRGTGHGNKPWNSSHLISLVFIPLSKHFLRKLQDKRDFSVHAKFQLKTSINSYRE